MNEDIKLFNDKNNLLNEHYLEVNAIDFYRDIFPLGSFERKGKYTDKKPNGIALIIDNDRYSRITVTDGLEQLPELISNDFVIFNGIAYYGKERTMYNASELYALIFDIDGLSDLNKLNNLLSHVSNEINPKPTYIVNSGHGVHLYYVFENPIPLYNHLKEPLKKLKYSLTGRLWNMYVSDIKEVQYQGLNQGFRMVGSPTKFGQEYKIKAYKSGEKITLEYLNSFLSEDERIEDINYKSSLSLEDAKIKYPEWYESKIIRKEKSKSWVVKRDLYDWWIRKIKEGATYGHRYFCIMTLSIYAIKCNIPYDELERDAMSLIPFLNNLNPGEPFTSYDVISALNSYEDSYKNFPREDIEKITAIKIKKNKRNGRNQNLHLRIARSTLDIMNEENGSALQGRKSMEEKILIYIILNPNLSPTELAKKAGVSRTTIYKYLKKYNDM